MKSVIAGVFAVLLYAGSASAATLGPLNCTGVPPAGFNPTELSGSIVCPQFNLAATLTSITLSLSGQVVGTIQITNDGEESEDGSADTLVRFSFTGLPGFAFANPLFTVAASTGPQTVAGGSSTVFPVAGSNGAAIVNNDNTQFAPYIGAGSFNFPVSTKTSLLVEFTGGNVTAKQSTTARADATVTYTYEDLTQVPEPTTMVLLGSGLLGLAMRRRRQR